MSSCDREKISNSESLEFPVKREMEDSLRHTAVKLENNDLVVSDGLFNYGSLFMNPEIEFKEEPETFESSEGDTKYSFDCDTLVGKDDSQSYKGKIDKEDERVKTGMKEECGIQLGSSWNEDREYLQNEEQIENSGCENPLGQESDSETHADSSMSEELFVCGNYEKQFSGVDNPNTYMLIHTGGGFMCKRCGKIFSEQGDLKAHFETHPKRKLFRCHVCNKAFYFKSRLIKHYRSHTGENPFKCDISDKAFSQKYNLNKHHKIHKGENPFKCDICGKAFSQKSAIVAHLRTHTGEKPFKCSICDKGFSLKCHLDVHHRIHTGEKPFKCTVCDKAFHLKSNLKAHHRCHNGEKPFKCTVCDKAFSRKYYLAEHHNIHTGEKPFRCNVCDEAFPQRSFLTRHYKTHT